MNHDLWLRGLCELHKKCEDRFFLKNRKYCINDGNLITAKYILHIYVVDWSPTWFHMN